MLHIIFRPAMAIMSRLKFALKLGLIGVLFLVPIAVLIYFLNDKIATDVAFTRAERAGVEQLVPARALIQSVQRYRRNSQLVMDGDKEALSKLGDIAADVETKIEELRKLNMDIGQTERSKADIAQLAKNWSELRQFRPHTRASLGKATAFMSEVVDCMSTIADDLNLSLDPDMDSYYLGQAVSPLIPNVINHMGQFRLIAARALKDKSLSIEDRVRLNVLYNQYLSDYQSLLSSLEKSLSAKPVLALNLQPRIDAVRETAKFFESQKVLEILDGKLELAPEEILSHGAGLKDLNALFDASIEQLDALLAARISSLQNALFVMCAVTGAVLILVLYLFGGMLLSVLRSLRSIQAGAERLAFGNVSEFAHSHSRDELRQVAFAVNCVNATLELFTKAQLDMARAHNQDGRISHEIDVLGFAGVYGEMARNLNETVQGHIGVQSQFVERMLEYTEGSFEKRMPPLPGERKAISDTAERLRHALQTAQEAAKETLKIKIALDNASSSLMMADNNGVIRYQNKACQTLMQQSEDNFRRYLPGFSAAGVQGTNFDQFHKIPSGNTISWPT